MAAKIHGPLGFLLNRLKTGIQTHDDAMKNEEDRLHTQFRKAGIKGTDAQAMAGMIVKHNYSNNPQTQANLLALMKHLGYVPHQSR